MFENVLVSAGGGIDFVDPGKMPCELLTVPGFIGQLKDHTMAVAPRPNEPLALAGALAMLAHLTGRSYVDVRGTHTNIYIAALAPSGMGKEEPRIVNKMLASAVGILGSVPDAIASGEGLEDAVRATPSLLLQTDEADALLTAMRGGDSRASKLNEMVLRFFSEAQTGHAMRLKAGDGKAEVIPMPHLTLFATGVPTFVYGALNAKALENGLLGRCLFIENDAFCPQREPSNEPLPETVVETARRLMAREEAFLKTGVADIVCVPETADAQKAIAALRAMTDVIAQKFDEKGHKTASVLYCRFVEKALKLALLYAISENPDAPCLSVEGLLWAAKFVEHVTHKMLYEVQFYVAEGSFDRLKKRTIRLLARHGGKLDHSTLLKHLGIPATTFKRLIQTLLMCGEIEDETLSDGKHGYILANA